MLHLHFVTIDRAASFLNQLLGDPLPLEGDEAEVLWFIVLALVDGSDHLGNVAELAEVLPDLVLTQSGLRQLSDVHLALLDVRLLHSDGFVLNC